MATGNKYTRASRKLAHKTVKGKNLKGESVQLMQTQPYQMSLFQQLAPDEQYGNTIELYDAIPKYHPARHLNRKRENGKYLPVLTRHFKHKDQITGITQRYEVTIKPAYLQDDEVGEKHYYPTEREELVEEALRKLATDGERGVYLNGQFGVQFTLYELRQELKRHNHAIRWDSLMDALHVGNEANLTVVNEAGGVVVKAPIFPVLLISNRNEWLSDPKNTKCYVQFNPLVTLSLNEISYRRHDYQRFMGYAHFLTRWLHKRLFHNFIQAGRFKPYYHLKASTIINESGLLHAARFVDNVKAIECGLNELQACQILYEWKKELRYHQNGKRLDDVKYELTVTHNFIDAMQQANANRKGLHYQAKHSGYLPSS